MTTWLEIGCVVWVEEKDDGLWGGWDDILLDGCTMDNNEDDNGMWMILE